jgi:hypothetical protein
LHSPTEFIARHNDWDHCRSDVVTARRLEEYSIAAADAVLCPSHYLARQAEAHYRLTAGAVTVIPYPLGDIQVVPRREETWERGTICFSGRLEPRWTVYAPGTSFQTIVVVPPDCESMTESLISGGGGTAEPEQAPLVHWSPSVHALPSLHAVPSGANTSAGHAPVEPSQLSAASH